MSSIGIKDSRAEDNSTVVFPNHPSRKMFNLKALLFSCAVSVIFWSSANADLVKAVRAQYSEYTGKVIFDNDPTHPTVLCKKALKNGNAFWANFQQNVDVCESNILCKLPDPYGPLKLNEFPPEGAVHIIGGGSYVDRKYSICINGKRRPLKEVYNYE